MKHNYKGRLYTCNRDITENKIVESLLQFSLRQSTRRGKSFRICTMLEVLFSQPKLHNPCEDESLMRHSSWISHLINEDARHCEDLPLLHHAVYETFPQNFKGKWVRWVFWKRKTWGDKRACVCLCRGNTCSHAHTQCLMCTPGAGQLRDIISIFNNLDFTK